MAPVFVPYDVTRDLQDRFLYSGNHEPEFYLDASACASIFTFETHGDEAEVRDGVAQLKTDIATGRFEDV